MSGDSRFAKAIDLGSREATPGPSFAEFTLSAPSSDAARKFWDVLEKQDMRSVLYTLENGDTRPVHYTPPIQIPRAIIRELAIGAKAACEFVRECFSDEAELRSHFERDGASFAGEKIHSEGLIAQTAEALRSGWNLAVAYDVLLTDKGPKILEVQSGIGYLGVRKAVVEAADQDPNARQSYFGPMDPIRLAQSLLERTNGEPIFVVDHKPLEKLFVGDQIAMARALAGPDAMPLNLENLIGRDGDTWLFFKEKRVGDTVQVTDEIVRVKHVICRSTQCDLDDLEKDTVQKTELHSRIMSFLKDGEVDWIYHPSHYNILSKQNLPDFCEYLRENAPEVAHHTSPLYKPDEALCAGQFALKQQDGNSGYGFALIEVFDSVESRDSFASHPGVTLGESSMANTLTVHYTKDCEIPYEERVHLVTVSDPSTHSVFRVPHGYIAQDRMNPYPYEVELPFSMPEGGNTRRTASLELRYMSPTPHKATEQSGSLIYRSAPRYDGEGQLTRTNISAIMHAYDAMLEQFVNFRTLPALDRRQLIEQSPFGMGAVIVASEL